MAFRLRNQQSKTDVYIKMTNQNNKKKEEEFHPNNNKKKKKLKNKNIVMIWSQPKK